MSLAPLPATAAHLAPHRVSLVVLTVTDAQRTVLTEWKTELRRLLDERAEKLAICQTRHESPGLRKSLVTALQNAYDEIARACLPARAALVDEAVASISRYFTHRGDARNVVKSFPAIVDLNLTLLGPPSDLQVPSLVHEAEHVIATIDRLLSASEFWSFTGCQA